MKRGGMEGELAVGSDGVVGVEDVVLDAGEVSHVGEHVDEDVLAAERRSGKVDDVGDAGFVEPGLQLVVGFEGGGVGKENVDDAGHEHLQLRLDGRGILVKRKVLQRWPKGTVNHSTLPELRLEVIGLKSSSTGCIVLGGGSRCLMTIGGEEQVHSCPRRQKDGSRDRTIAKSLVHDWKSVW